MHRVVALCPSKARAPLPALWPCSRSWWMSPAPLRLTRAAARGLPRPRSAPATLRRPPTPTPTPRATPAGARRRRRSFTTRTRRVAAPSGARAPLTRVLPPISPVGRRAGRVVQEAGQRVLRPRRLGRGRGTRRATCAACAGAALTLLACALVPSAGALQQRAGGGAGRSARASGVLLQPRGCAAVDGALRRTQRGRLRPLRR